MLVWLVWTTFWASLKTFGGRLGGNGEWNARYLVSMSSSSSSSSSASVIEEVVVEVVPDLSQVQKEAWDQLLQDDDSPFLQYEWLVALEKTGCVGDRTGWKPFHLIATYDDKVLAAIPMYLKSHSMGEFIFDQSWAEAAYAWRIPYYPKMLGAIPFTPATGRRLLMRQDIVTNKSDRDRILDALIRLARQICETNKFSSVHFNFLHDKEVEILTQRHDYLLRHSMQYHWQNANPQQDGRPYESFEDYLSCFSSKRRIKIKRERRSVYEDQGISIKAYKGDDIREDMVDLVFDLYLTTIRKMSFWGRQYLNRQFFRMILLGPFKKYICLVLCTNRDGKVVAGTFNVVKNKRFYGRYWGSFPEYPVKNLHFETCYYFPIQYCIEHDLEVMEPGAGGGNFKFLRGYDPVVISSCHYLADRGLYRAVEDFLERERDQIQDVVDELNDMSALKKGRGSEESQDPDGTDKHLC